MGNFTTTRRQLLGSAAAAATMATLGIKPRDVLAAEGDVLKVRMNGELLSLDPAYYDGSLAETAILWACMPRLAVVVKNADGSWGWQASEFVEHVTPDDPTHITFALKPGHMWSDNLGELSADDVKYSFERMLKSDHSTRWPNLDHVEVKDRHSGVIVLKAPFGGTFLMGIASDSGTILPKAAMVKLKDEKFTTELPGQLGPYRLDSWIPKQRAVLAANPDWKGTAPAFSQIVMVQISDTKAADLAFDAHEIDITNIGLDGAAHYKKNPAAHSRLLQLPGPFYTWMGMNTSNAKLSDIRVRKAIQRAVDVDSILEGAYYGTAPHAYGVVPLGILGHRDSAKYGYDPEEAKDLLKQAGVGDLSLSLTVQTDEPEQIQAAQIIQANLGDVGIQVKILPTDPGLFWNLGLESKGDDWKRLELTLMRYACLPDPSDAITWFRKEQIGIWNWERWSDPAFETLWAQGLTEADTAKRAAIYVQMQAIMEDTGAYVWLTFDPLYNITIDKVAPVFDPLGAMQPGLFKKA